jgi:gamma-glutamylcyclotransferase (GGCT)/AIG2-like uncharacterized protein YtfP
MNGGSMSVALTVRSVSPQAASGSALSAYLRGVRRMFLNGTAMSGQPDHHAVTGARFLGGTRTAPLYRFYAVRDAFPGLYPIPPGSGLVGASIEGELYELPEEMLYDSLMPEEPAELELGVIELADGTVVNAMHLQFERLAPQDHVVDIAGLGGWRAYQDFLADQQRLAAALQR